MGDDKKSNMPENTAFKQQRLPAWQPVLTAKNVLPTFLIIGLAFIPLGVVLLLTSNNCFEKMIDYTECEAAMPGVAAGKKCHQFFNEEFASGNYHPKCTCKQNFTLDADVDGPLYFYYRLTNFYQNHRIYVKSRDNAQLAGKAVTSLNSDCKPYEVDSAGKPIAPCGTIANSLFNDTYQLSTNTGASIITMDRNNIAWKTDHETKFNNPSGSCPASPPTNNLTCAFPDSARPPFWEYGIEDVWKITNFNQTDVPANSENGYENQALEVWMRTAAFPTFRKLYGIVNDGLKAGDYQVEVKYNYPVVGFDGTKSFVIAQMTWAGGKNPFLGIAYIVVGSMSLISAIALFVVHKRHQGSRPN